MIDAMFLPLDLIRPLAFGCAVAWLLIGPVLLARWLTRRRRGI